MARWIHRFELKPGTWVFVPDEESREFGKNLKSDLEDRWKIPPYYAHLRRGGHVEAIRRHLKNRIFMRADIRNFFGQIGLSRVTRSLNKFYRYDDARAAAKESVVRSPTDPSDTILPFGFVQSPILASICLRNSKLGSFLEKLNRQPNVAVSVYVDDIIVSTTLDEAAANEIFEEMNATASASGLEFGPDKLEPPSEQILAFNISLTHGHMEITQSRLERMAYDAISADNGQVVQGILGYIESVSPRQAKIISDSIESQQE